MDKYFSVEIWENINTQKTKWKSREIDKPYDGFKMGKVFWSSEDPKHDIHFCVVKTDSKQKALLEGKEIINQYFDRRSSRMSEVMSEIIASEKKSQSKN
jgi:hypothetical protein